MVFCINISRASARPSRQAIALSVATSEIPSITRAEPPKYFPVSSRHTVADAPRTSDLEMAASTLIFTNLVEALLVLLMQLWELLHARPSWRVTLLDQQ